MVRTFGLVCTYFCLKSDLFRPKSPNNYTWSEVMRTSIIFKIRGCCRILHWQLFEQIIMKLSTYLLPLLDPKNILFQHYIHTLTGRAGVKPLSSYWFVWKLAPISPMWPSCLADRVNLHNVWQEVHLDGLGWNGGALSFLFLSTY